MPDAGIDLHWWGGSKRFLSPLRIPFRHAPVQLLQGFWVNQCNADCGSLRAAACRKPQPVEAGTLQNAFHSTHIM